MATLDVSVTSEWVDIKDSLSLTAGSTYSIDNVLGDIVYTRYSTSAPASGTLLGRPLQEKESREVVIGSEGFWIRTGGSEAKVVVTPIVPASSVVVENADGAQGTGATLTTTRTEQGGITVTSTTIDLTGLSSTDTANAVIGASGAASDIAFIGRNVIAENGVIFKTEFSCIETPVGGDNSVDVVKNSDGELAFGDAGGTSYLSDSGDLVAGQTIENLLPAIAEGDYFYLSAGEGDVAAVYTAGQYMFTTYGRSLLV